MFQLLGRAGAHICGAEQLVSAVLAEPLVASRLGVKVGAALIDLRSLMIDQKGRAVEYVEMLAVPEHLKLRFTVHPETLKAPPRATSVTKRKR
jgi:GntR family transcriptional regulator